MAFVVENFWTPQIQSKVKLVSLYLFFLILHPFLSDYHPRTYDNYDIQGQREEFLKIMEDSVAYTKVEVKMPRD